jgi:predicted phosphoribosyltransferase
MDTPFRDRHDAGRCLAQDLSASYANRTDVVVLGLPRGGVPVAYEVAVSLEAPLDVFLVRKLGVPGHEELAMGAIATGGVRVLNRDVIESWRIPEAAIVVVEAAERRELARRERLYRGTRPPPDVRGKTVILVDDGLATGSSMRAAAEALRAMGPDRIVVAVPVAAATICESLRDVVDETVCALTPDLFYAVGLWYEDFSPTTDDEVRELLRKARERANAVDTESPRVDRPGRRTGDRHRSTFGETSGPTAEPHAPKETSMVTQHTEGEGREPEHTHPAMTHTHDH